MRHIPTFSVIMPIYNVAHYLPEAIESVLGQSYRDFELICIDDGSTDDSMSIAEGYATKDARIKVVHQNNIGLGATRNRGLGYARGKYVYYMDSDDKIRTDALKCMVQHLEGDSLDVLLFDSEVLDEDPVTAHDLLCYTRRCSYPGVWNGAELYLKLIARGEYRAPAYLSVAKRSYLVEEGIRCAEGIIHEDELYTFLLLLKARRVGIVSERLYVRRYRPGSIMTDLNKMNSLNGYIHVLQAMLEMGESCAQRRAIKVGRDAMVGNCWALLRTMPARGAEVLDELATRSQCNEAIELLRKRLGVGSLSVYPLVFLRTVCGGFNRVRRAVVRRAVPVVR